MAVDLLTGVEASGNKEAKTAVGKLANADINRAVRLAKDRMLKAGATTPVYEASDCGPAPK